MTDTAAAPAFNAFRLIDDGERLAIHAVAIDDAGAVVAFDPEPVRLEVASNMGSDSSVPSDLRARWRITGLAFGAANCTFATAPVLLLRDGKLIDMPAHGGEDAAPVRAMREAIAA